MPSWVVIRASTLGLLGIALVVVGFIPALSFIVHSLAPGLGAALDFLPKLTFGWLADLQAALPPRKVMLAEGQLPGLIFALLGVAVMVLGHLVVTRQKAVLAVAKLRKADRLRRVAQYRNARVDPFPTGGTLLEAGMENRPDRRVA